MQITPLTAAHAPVYRTLMLEAYAQAADAFTSTAEERAREPLTWWEQRLASPRLRDRRISLGCVVVPVAFYREVIAPHLGRSRSVVYVLPETRPLDTLFDGGAGPQRMAWVRTASH